MATIPLDCTICPKKPSFSDVSHLLTHIASKGHLSHYYKLKVKSSTDQMSRTILNNYDQWYAGWNVEGLMSERMSLKDKKRPRARQGPSRTLSVTSSGPQQPRAARGRPAGSTKLSLHLRNLQATPFDADDRVDYGTNLSMMATAPQNFTMPAVMRSQPHLMQENMHSMMARPRSLYDPFNFRFESFADRHPHMTRTGSTYSLDDFKTASTQDEPSDLSSPPDDVKTPSWTDESLASTEDHSRLKGIQWPGMSLFDSATPGSKRRRNQRKEAGVLEKLEADSLTIEATEQVWTPNGNLRKEKRISGMPSSSPLADVTPPPPKKGRAALAQLNGSRYSLRGSQLGRRATWADDDLESDLTWGPPRAVGKKKRKRGFEVWEDEDGGDRHSRGPATFSRPRLMTQLTRGFTPQQENISNEAYAYSSLINRYTHEDLDVKQVMKSRPVEPGLFEIPHQQQSRFSMAQPSQTGPTAAVSSENIPPFAQAAAGMFDFSASNVSWQQFEGNTNHLSNTFYTPVRHNHASNFVQQSVQIPNMTGQVFTPTNGNNGLFNMLPPLSAHRHQTPGMQHARDSSMELRNAILAASQPPLPTSVRSSCSFFQDFPRTAADDTTPIRRTQSFPHMNSPTPNAGLQTLTDAVTLMDTVMEGRTPALSVRQLLTEQSSVESLVDLKDPVDDDRTITAPGTPADLPMDE